MPVKRLHPHLVKRLQRVAHRLLTPARVRRMKNIDHRKERHSIPMDGIAGPGYRVRELRVRKENSRVPVVIKRDHLHATPASTLAFLRMIVKDHNAVYQPTQYRLFVPHAYALNDSYLAMAKTEYPSITEIFGDGTTKRGTKFFTTLRKKHSVTLHQLREAADTVSLRTGFPIGNILLIGVRNKKFIFVPLVDRF